MTQAFSIYHDGYGECPPEYVVQHITWCGENVDGKWYCDPPHQMGDVGVREIILHYTFVFEDDEDAMAFKLRWL